MTLQSWGNYFRLSDQSLVLWIIQRIFFLHGGAVGFQTRCGVVKWARVGGGGCLICSVLIPFSLKLQWSVSIHRTGDFGRSPPVRGLQVWGRTHFSAVAEQANAFSLFSLFFLMHGRDASGQRSRFPFQINRVFCVSDPSLPDLMSWFRNYAAFLRGSSFVLWCPEQSTNTP